ncbi:MAG: carboxypeptidase M32 [Fervidicoccaceae archaeon]
MEKKYFSDPLIIEILENYKPIWSINYAISLIQWDMETYMPPEGIEERGKAYSHLAVLQHRLLLSPDLQNLVEKAKGREGLTDQEKGVVRVLDREIERAKKLPEKLIAELREVTTKAHEAWLISRERSEAEPFLSYLDRIVSLEREMAEKLGYEEHPYDALIDYFEEGFTTRKGKEMFDAIIPNLKRALEKVMGDDYFPRCHYLESYRYDVERAKKVNERVLEVLSFPRRRARIDVSPHPFTINMGQKDVRITTRYEGHDIRRTILSTIHEYGHALYELQIDEALSGTPIGTGVSMGVHESQSRFWENIVGRSRAFSSIIGGILREELPELKAYDDEEIYRYVNLVRPSFIRVDADELTYNFHIALRFNIERMLIAGEVKTAEVPELWNNLMDELLGIRPRKYSEGFLQDIHWSQGSFGYFPSYSLGTVIAAQVKAKMEDETRKMDEIIEKRDFAAIREWLREKIHKYGATYAPRELLVKSLGEDINPSYYIKYIEEKYSR